ncbi:MAG: PAS domain S-box protein [Desulfobacteraceae bacterium]
MNNNFLLAMIEESSFAFACHKIIKDDKNSPCDYEFIDVNLAFLELTGLTRESVIGKTVNEIMPETGTNRFKWTKFYGELPREGGSRTFEEYSESLKKWFKVYSFSKGDGNFSTVFIDITSERQKSEELEGFFSVNLDLLCIADTDGNFVKVNKEWGSVLGYSADELYSRKFIELVHPDDLQSTLKAMSELKKQNKILNFVNRYRAKNGSYRFIEWRSYPEGNLIYAAARDVTENRLREQALEESDSTLRGIAEFAYDAIIMIDDKGKISFWNPSAERIFGYSRKEASGADLHELIAPQRFYPAYEKAFCSFRETGKGDVVGKTIETAGIRKDGEEIRIALSLSAIKLKEKWGAVGIVRDITEQKKYERKLAESELNFRSFFETIDHMIFAGNSDGKIFYTNPSVTRKLGFTGDELEGMDIIDIYAQKDRIKAEEILADMLAGKRFSCFLPLQRKDKTELPAETRIWSGKWNGKECIFSISKDLSKEQEALDKFNSLFDSNPALMAVTNLQEKKFTEVNVSFLETLGYAKDEVIGKSADDLNIFAEKEKLEDIRSRLNVKDCVRNEEVKVKTKYGSVLTGLLSGQVIQSQSGSYVLTVMTDFSAQKEAEGKLVYYSEMQNILMRIASKYINIPVNEADLSINKALADIGRYFNSDRVYIFDYNFENNTTSNLYEWCSFGTEPQIDELQNVPLEGLNDWLKAHLDGRAMMVKNTSELPEGSLKKILLPQGIKTLITVPLKYKGELSGFIGFDWVKDYHDYTQVEINLLYLFAEILVNTKARIESEILLAEKQERLDLALKGTNAGLWDWYIQSGNAVFDKRWAEIAGYDLSELEPVSIRTWIDLCHPEDLEKSNKALEEHFSGKTDFYESEARMKHKSGEDVWVLDRGRVVEWDKDGRPLRMTGTHIDITQRKKAEEMIRHLANHDALTGLPTMRLAKDRAFVANERARRNKKMTAFMFVDLDGFKLVNDTYGHEAGDAVLKEVVARLNSSVRKSDTVSRIGGDEFLIIINEISALDLCEKIAQNIIAKISAPFKYHRNEMKIGCSVGISIYPENGEDIDKLIRKADEAMYSIKKSGKNNYAFA